MGDKEQDNTVLIIKLYARLMSNDLVAQPRNEERKHFAKFDHGCRLRAIYFRRPIVVHLLQARNNRWL